MTERQRQLLAPMPMGAAEVALLVARVKAAESRVRIDEQSAERPSMFTDDDFARMKERQAKRARYRDRYRAKQAASCH